MKTLLFYTSYAESAEQWQKTLTTWIDSVNVSGVHYDQILIPDDGSLHIPVLKEIDYFEQGHIFEHQPLQTIVVYKFLNRLGRPALFDQPGWYRSFVYAGVYAKQFGFDKVIHIEADCSLVSKRFVNYLDNFQTGWEAFWCPRHQLSESSIQVIAGADCIEAYSLFDKIDYSHFRGTAPDPREFDQTGYLPFTTNKNFIGDRYGEYTKQVPANADYACQLTTDIPRWWLKNSKTR